MKPSRTSKTWVAVFISVIIPLLIIVASMFTFLSTDIYIPTLVSLILLLITFVYWELGGKVDRVYDEFGTDLNELKNQVEHFATIRPVREPDFYDRFQADVEEANRRVWISFLDNQDPRQSTDDEKVEYYDNIGNTIKRKSASGVEFRRIVRAAPEIDPWVDEMMENMDGVSRFSLACLPDNQPNERSIPHVSVQLIDDDISYFVAVGEQQESAEPRDMYVKSMELNDQWSRYYQRMWSDSFVVFRRGSLQEEEYEEYKQFLESQ